MIWSLVLDMVSMRRATSLTFPGKAMYGSASITSTMPMTLRKYSMNLTLYSCYMFASTWNRLQYSSVTTGTAKVPPRDSGSGPYTAIWPSLPLSLL